MIDLRLLNKKKLHWKGRVLTSISWVIDRDFPYRTPGGYNMAMATHDSGASGRLSSLRPEQDITLLLSGQTAGPVIDVSFHELTGFDPGLLKTY